jgi:hypothetical protein
MLLPTTDLWQMSLKLQMGKDPGSPVGSVLLTEVGPLRWKLGQKVVVRISACEDDGMLTSLNTWNAFAPRVPSQ